MKDTQGNKTPDSRTEIPKTVASCRYMDEPFTKNCIYSAIDSVFNDNGVFRYEYVLGLDIGGGGNTAHILKYHYNYTEDGKKHLVFDIRPAYLDENRRKEIPSMIAFTDKNLPVIGFPAREKKVFYSNFKTSPALWAKEEEEKRGTITCKELTKAFIFQLFNQILSFNSFPDEGFDVKKAFEDKKLLICIGCPASPDWTKKEYLNEYKRLVSDACGISENDVYVLPESTAAVMSVASGNFSDDNNRKKKVDISTGLCIIDLGAVSTDITYILPGKRIVTHSFNLGGQDIDKQMLEKAIADNRGISKRDIPPEQIPYILSLLREYKEVFYENGTATRDTVKLWTKSANGFIDSDKELRLEIDESFMDDVLDRPLPGRGKSISEIFENELNNKVIMPLSGGRYICGRLIISGGTGKVHRFRKIIKKIFGDEITDIDTNPGKRVSKGLCEMKRFEISGADSIGAYRKAEENAIAAQYERFIDELCSYLTEITAQQVNATVEEALKSSADKFEISALCKEITERCKSDERISGADMQNKLSEIITDCTHSFIKTMTDEADKLSKRIYNSSIISISPSEITKQLFDKELLLSQIQPAVTTLWEKKLSSGILVIISVIALLLLGALNPLLPIVAVILLFINVSKSEKDNKKSIIDILDERDIYISKKALKLINKKTAKSKKYNKAMNKMKEEFFSQSEIKDFFTDILGTHSEIIFGKVLLLVFDE